MRAIVIEQFGDIDAAQPSDSPEPKCGTDDVLIEVAAAPVNYVDLLVIGGKYQFLPELPFVPGKGPAGTVRAVGADVKDFRVGDRVLAMAEIGGYAELAKAPASQCYALPTSMTFNQAAAVSLSYDTAWFALRERGRLRSGERVLVLGASGAVGIAAVQLGRAFGAKVIGAVARPERAAAVLDAGADAVVDLSAANLRDSLRDQIRAATNGGGVDVIVDTVGGDAFEAALRALNWCGRCVVVGFAAGSIPTVRANYLLVKNIEVSGLQISDYRKRRPDLVRTCFSEILALFEAGRIRLGEVETFPFDRVTEALRRVRDRQARGRVVLSPGG